MKTLAVSALVLSVSLLSVGSAAAQSFVVGTKNFTEQYILGEIYAAALEDAGIPVERRINLGGTLIAHQALLADEIDMYPEYTGTALVSVVKGDISSDADAVYEQVKSHYENEFDVTWLEPANINNGYAIVVRPETAQEHGLETLSDLSAVSGDLVIGAGPEFGDRRDGIPGLRDVYGIEFGEFRQFAKLGLRYDALAAEQIDVANGFATDWQIANEQFVPLIDDKGLFPPYYVAPVVREDALEEFPQAREVLNRVSVLLDNETMQQLNARVERDREEAADVAVSFLKEQGIID